MGEEDVKQFLETQRRISKIKSVTNEREVRLIDVEGKPTKKSKVSSNGQNKTASNSDEHSSSNKPIIPLTEIPEEGTPDRITKSDKQKQSMIKAQADRKKSTKRSFAMSGTSENSAVIKTNKTVDSIARTQQKMWYKVVYFCVYYWLALNDHFRLIFIPKSGDIAFFIFTLMLVIVFIVDIIARSFAEKGYFPRFYFVVDIFSACIIVYSSSVTSVSIFITVSFLKIIMIVRITDMVSAYKQVITPS
jgi:hypothetical protein